jgi:lipopolysaccharide transport system ATP-binding protein
MLVDEVLAVGDVAFQRKCLGRMGDVAREGRTVIFVSHNLAVLQALCRRGILIEHGRVEQDGGIEDCISLYLQKLEQAATQDLLEREDGRGWHEYRVTSVDVRSENAQTPGLLRTGEPVHFVFRCSEVVPSMTCAFTISNQLGHPVAEFKSAVGSPLDGVDPELDRCFVCSVDVLPFVPGRYRIDLELRARGVEQHLLDGAAIFQVEPGVLEGRAVEAGSRASTAVAHRWTRSPA